MAVKYVKDFAFDSGFGFTGSKGATPVRAYMRGGAVKKSMNEGSKKAGPRAPALAPAMVEKRSQGLGGLAPETKKLAAYNKPHMEGKKGAKVPQYAKGGAVKKKMPSFLKAKMMKKADGGDVGKSSLYEEDMMFYKPPRDDSAVAGGRSPEEYEANQSSLAAQIAREKRLMTGPGPKQKLEPTMQDLGRESIMPTGDLTSLPEEPPFDSMRGVSLGDRVPAPISPLAAQIAREKRLMTGPGTKLKVAPQPSPLAAAARMAPQDRRAMRADRREMARDIMDRYIAGPRRAMPAPRRAMPVAPRAPMVEPAMIRNPRMPVGGVATFAKGGKVSKGQAKVGKVMGEFKRGELHSGSKQGPLVTNPKQAKAIALSEARAAGAKIPKKAMGGKACG